MNAKEKRAHAKVLERFVNAKLREAREREMDALIAQFEAIFCEKARFKRVNTTRKRLRIKPI